MKNFTSYVPLCISFKKVLPLMLLFLTLSFYGQTVSDVFPTRVTEQTKVTILGSGFTESTTVNIPDISIGA